MNRETIERVRDLTNRMREVADAVAFDRREELHAMYLAHEHLVRILAAAKAHVSDNGPPPIIPGDRVIVANGRYHGDGIAWSQCEWHSSCVASFGNGWFVAVKLENGNVWWYEADTVRLATPADSSQPTAESSPTKEAP